MAYTVAYEIPCSYYMIPILYFPLGFSTARSRMKTTPIASTPNKADLFSMSNGKIFAPSRLTY